VPPRAGSPVWQGCDGAGTAAPAGAKEGLPPWHLG
jgi:hypothetical protein